MRKKILVTGGAGFVGYHLIKHLQNDPDVSITMIDNLWRSSMDTHLSDLLKNTHTLYKEADVSDPKTFDGLGTFDHVYHLAAVNGTDNFYKMPAEVLRINTLSLFHVLEWMKNHNAGGKLMFTSSNEAYASNLEAFNTLPLPTPENVPLSIADTYNPRWSYGGSKLIGELAVIHYAQSYNFRAVIVRPHNFYGPRSGYGHVIPQIIERIIAETDPFPIYGAHDTRSFGYISDAVSAMVDVMNHRNTDEKVPHTIHLGSMDEIVIKDLIEKLFEIAGWHPEELVIHASPQGSVRRRCPDTSKLRDMIGYDTKTTLEEGLRATFEWYKNNPRLTNSSGNK
jgi:UDP-glucose 4-epimerase